MRLSFFTTDKVSHIFGYFCLPGFLIAILFSDRIAPVFLGLAALIGLYAAYREKRLKSIVDWFQKYRLIYILIGAFLFWCLVSLIWSPHDSYGAKRIIRFFLIVLAGSIALKLFAPKITYEHLNVSAYCLGGCTVIVLILYFLNSWGVFADGLLVNRTVLTYALFYWPLAVFLQRNRHTGLLIILTILIVFLVVNSDSQTALFALLVGSMAMLVPTLPMKLGLRVIVPSLMAVFVIIMPIIPHLMDLFLPSNIYAHLEESHARERIDIWLDYVVAIQEKPIFGWGFGFHRILKDMASELDLLLLSLPRHPHNFALEIWVDLGLVGIGIIAVFLFYVSWVVLNKSNRYIAPKFGFLSSVYAASLVGFGAFQSWWLSSIFMMLLIWNALENPEDSK